MVVGGPLAGENGHMAPRSPLLLPAIAAILVAVLTGCAERGTAEPTATPSETPSSEPTPEPTEPSEQPATPIDVPCDTLVTADTMYTFNPNFSLAEDWEPDAGTDGAAAVEQSGVACRWLNESSDIHIDLSVASLSHEQLEQLKNDAVTVHTMVPTYGEEAYFSVVDEVGTAIVFDRSYWIVMSSAYFFEPGDATELVNSVLDALP